MRKEATVLLWPLVGQFPPWLRQTFGCKRGRIDGKR